MSRALCLFVVLLSGGLALFAPNAAQGGPWTHESGRGQIIMSSGRKVAPVGAFTGGSPDRDDSFTQILAEVGLLDSLTVGARVYAEVSAVELTDATLGAGLLVRQRLHRDDRGNVVSVELAGSLPAESLVSEAVAASNPDSTPEFGFSALYGTSWWGGWGSAWLGAAGGWTWRSEGTADELRGQLAGGVRPWDCCMAMLGFYGTAPLSEGTEASLSIAPSFAYSFGPDVGRNTKKPQGPVNAVTLQIGLSYNVLDTDEGLGFQISWWRPF
ncbi:hypothetical protein H0I76_06090 [Limibaculum sp. M0105]|uniref:Transporter n=1 Tax=Thermohalobaculum xanthum TaxID=2753746 RepID=A0A8J7SG00_9RHOB|nr:hypothetical protein [Thermohalobaculum xanthum]MBK0398750.1 hypothetical protein [Thermohalobaculum xanthum]